MAKVLYMTTSELDPDDVRAHLSMMQSVITRMDDNSRSCKTWALTLVAAILVVVTKFDTSVESNSFGPLETWIAVVPTSLFWMLDSYYLGLERAFRESYNQFVERLHDNELEQEELFQIGTHDAKWQYGLPSLFSISTFPFYAVLGVGILVAWLVS